jgi:phosphoglycolate phosphatase-like HAD superfamily hydrolase
VGAVSALAVELDALADSRGLWDAWLADASRRYASIAGLDAKALPGNRAEAAALLDEWADHGIGDWRAALARFAEDHAAVHIRRDAGVALALRALAGRGVRLGVFTDAPEPLARVVLAQLGADRRVDAVEAGVDALERLVAALGECEVARTRDDLIRAADYDPVHGVSGPR